MIMEGEGGRKEGKNNINSLQYYYFLMTIFSYYFHFKHAVKAGENVPNVYKIHLYMYVNFKQQYCDP